MEEDKEEGRQEEEKVISSYGHILPREKSNIKFYFIMKYKVGIKWQNVSSQTINLLEQGFGSHYHVDSR